MKAVDINCDLGEGFGRWQIGDAPDEQLMELIGSANIAAGFHAGDPMIIDRTVRQAARRGVGIGAHPGYRDLQGFGRRSIAATVDELVNDIVYQTGAVQAFAARHGTALAHVKPHGALYMDMAKTPALAEAFIAAMQAIVPRAFVFCLPGSATEAAARAAGQPVVREFYADRDYDDSGSIVFVRDAGAYEPAALAAKCVRACTQGRVRTVTGADIAVEFESICVHSDTPGAKEILQALHAAFAAAGIAVRPVAAAPAQ